MQKRTLFIIVGGVVALVILACLGCFALSWIVSLSPTVKATVTARAIANATTTMQAIAKATEAARPTNTPSPTDTPTPTNTPVPSSTPTPTNTLDPKTATAQAIANKNATATAQAIQARQGTATAQTATAEARVAKNATSTAQAMESLRATAIAYTSEVAVRTIAYKKALDECNELNQEMANRPALLLDDSWKYDIAIALASLQIAGEKLAGIRQVPPAFAEANRWLQKVDQETKLFVNNYARGVDNLNSTYIDYAVVNMQNITVYIKRATEEIEKAMPR